LSVHEFSNYTGALWLGERWSTIGTLYLVATPIGNLEDITLRALRVLGEVSLIAAEDTRHSGRLLKHFNISTPMTSFHEHSDTGRQFAILDALERGDVALISDAGTPGISDPGFPLVVAALERGHHVTPIPGPSAAMAAVPASGLVPNGFLYLGFLPRRHQERRATLKSVANLPFPLVIYEAPHRLLSALSDLHQELGDRPMAIARELTKLHEEIRRTSIAQAISHYQQERPRGEFVLVVGVRSEQPEQIDVESDAVLGLLTARMAAGDSPSAAARTVAKQTGIPRSELYRRTREIDRLAECDEQGVSRKDREDSGH
jgi:16S rRNA (cytidine1402-2'-O)-methyltransferase